MKDGYYTAEIAMLQNEPNMVELNDAVSAVGTAVVATLTVGTLGHFDKVFAVATYYAKGPHDLHAINQTG